MKRKTLKLYITVAVSLLAFSLLGGCAEGSGQDAASMQTQNTTGPILGEDATEMLAVISVDTPYMTYHYPEEWADQLQILHTDDGRNYTSAFQMEMEGKTVQLFSVVLGPDESEGYLLGKILDENAGQINVYSVVNAVPREEWTEEAYKQINACQEYVNEIIIQFYEDPRFASSGPN